jgi:hypothetical protein
LPVINETAALVEFGLVDLAATYREVHAFSAFRFAFDDEVFLFQLVHRLLNDMERIGDVLS